MNTHAEFPAWALGMLDSRGELYPLAPPLLPHIQALKTSQQIWEAIASSLALPYQCAVNL